MRVLVACEFSGIVRRAFAARGHDAWSCDLLPAEDRSNRHIVGDVRDVLADGWDLLPPLAGTDAHKAWSRVHRMPPGPDRARERSRFFPGIAAAMADQWGGDADDVGAVA